MDTMTNKLLQHAGKYVLLGKLTLALEQYLKILQLEPGDTTIMNTIGDLYCRIEDREQALYWYQKLADTFEYREMPSNAIAAYRKILKLSPKNMEVMIRLAELYERQGQQANARLQYKVLGNQWMAVGNFEKALEFYTRVCKLLPDCPDSRLELAQIQERADKKTEACKSYLMAAELMVRQGNLTSAASVVESIFRLSPQDKELVKSFFNLLCNVNMTERGIEYVQSVALDNDPDFRAMLAEVFLHDGNFEVAQKFLLPDLRKNPKMVPASMKMLQQLIDRGDLAACLDVAEAVLESSIQQKDELNLKRMLDGMLRLDSTSIRTLKTLTTLLIRMNDKGTLESYLKQLVILQLQSGNLREAKDTFNKMVIYGQSSFYLDLLNDLNNAMARSPDELRETCHKVIRALERGSLEQDETLTETGPIPGVADLDLGLGLEIQLEVELFSGTTNSTE